MREPDGPSVKIRKRTCRRVLFLPEIFTVILHNRGFGLYMQGLIFRGRERKKQTMQNILKNFRKKDYNYEKIY